MKNTALLLLASTIGCVVQTDPVRGLQGDKGDPGKDGVIENTTVSDLQTKISDMQEQLSELQAANVELQEKLDTLQTQLANPDCPFNYVKSPFPPADFLPNAVLCTDGPDEVVRVDSGTSVFWVDRYESSIWTTVDGPISGVQKFSMSDDTDPAVFPKNGNATAAWFALSVSAVLPATNVTWFQASAACAASGKRLPTGSQWLRAALGTLDPSANDGSQNAKCNTQSPSTRKSGIAIGVVQTESCTSVWGAEDMIGNIWEWTDEWQSGLYGISGYGTPATWPNAQNGSFSGDGSFNVSSAAAAAGPGQGTTVGLPSAAVRGGYRENGEMAGLAAIGLEDAPSMWRPTTGFRCVIGR